MSDSGAPFDFEALGAEPTAAPARDSVGDHARDSESPAFYGRRSDDHPVDEDGNPMIASNAIRKERRRLRALTRLVAVLMIPAVGLFALNRWYQQQTNHTATGGRKVLLTVKPGWGNGDIADALEHAHVIGHAWVMNVYIRLHAQPDVQAGDYTLQTGMGIKPALAVLHQGPQATKLTLRILPGLWLPEVAQQVAKQLNLDATKFRDLVITGAVRSKYQPPEQQTTEGLLYPDTYFFARDVKEIDVVRRMVQRFDEVADSLDADRFAAKLNRRSYDVIKTAAIVQLEVRRDVERRLVASVIYNRLNVDMKLQIDAMVMYAIGERKPETNDADRSTDSPFNSYRYKGLGDNPIATLSRDSLYAALHPARTNYVYYVLVDPKTGRQAFSATYEEFLRNVEIGRRNKAFG